MNEFKEVLTVNLRKHRSRLNYSQEKLAELCDISQTFVALVETGKRFPSADTLSKFSAALRVKPHELFLGKEEELDHDRRIRTDRIVSEFRERVNREIETMLGQLR